MGVKAAAHLWGSRVRGRPAERACRGSEVGPPRKPILPVARASEQPVCLNRRAVDGITLASWLSRSVTPAHSGTPLRADHHRARVARAPSSGPHRPSPVEHVLRACPGPSAARPCLWPGEGADKLGNWACALGSLCPEHRGRTEEKWPC